jgi:hypothetical protein
LHAAHGLNTTAVAVGGGGDVGVSEERNGAVSPDDSMCVRVRFALTRFTSHVRTLESFAAIRVVYI